MPPVLSKPSGAARTALFYITSGALMTVWALVWIFFLPPERPIGKLICYGLLLSGIVLLVIGFLLGRIGREARHAELPPPEATPTAARTAPAPPQQAPPAGGTTTNVAQT